MTHKTSYLLASVTQVIGLLMTIIGAFVTLFGGPDLYWIVLGGLVLITSALGKRLDLIEEGSR